MRAVVDIGSNSVKFLIGDLQQGRPQILEEGSGITRLARGLDSSGLLSPVALRDTEDLLLSFKTRFDLFEKSHNTKLDCVVLATAAARDCKNPEELALRVKKVLGTSLRILSGLEEAHLSSLGARAAAQSLNPEAKHFVCCEIGGASTQVTIETGKDIRRHSFPMGAVRAQERLALGEGALSAQAWIEAGRKMNSLFDAKWVADFKNKAAKLSPETALVVVGGTLVMAARMAKARSMLSGGARILSLTEIEMFADSYRKLSPQERLALEGMVEGRADILPYSLLILIHWAKLLGRSELWVTPWGLRYGALNLAQPSFLALQSSRIFF